MKKTELTILGLVVLGLLAIVGIYGCSSNWDISGNTEKIQAGSPNNAPVDVIGVKVEKKF